MQKEIIRSAHGVGHFGIKKTVDLINKEYFIRNLVKKVEEFILNCVTCILASKRQGKQEGFLQPIDKVPLPLDTYHVDHLGPLTSTKKGYNYIFSVIDAFTKFVWIYPTKSTGVNEVLSKLKTQQAIFGNPRRIISDRGGAFVSGEFRDYCVEENIQHILVTTGVPRGNGQVERLNRIIISVLTKLSIERPENWYQHIEKLQRFINCTHQRSIATNPFKLLFGTQMRIKQNVNLMRLVEEENQLLFEEERNELRKEAKLSISKVQEENKKTFDKKRKQARMYKIGDVVAIMQTQFGSGMKLRPRFLGPYEVVEIIGKDRYGLQKLGNSKGSIKTTSSADHMKLWGNEEGFSNDDLSSGSDEDQVGRM